MLPVLFGFLRGYKEGMVMTKPGVRDHKLFKYYHVLSVVVFIVFAFMVKQYIKIRPSIIYIFGACLLMWEFTEIGYTMSLYGKMVWCEHINFADIISINIEGIPVMALHIVRLISGTCFVFLGREK